MIPDKDEIKLTNWEIVSVNPNDKTWTWKDLFCFWGNNIQSIIGFSLITSLYLVYELNFFIVFIGTLIGVFFVYIFVNLIGKPSQKHGIPFPVIMRTSFGVKGAKYFALLRGLVGTFMFGVQSYFLSKAFGYLIRISFFSIDSSLLDKDIFLIFFLGMNIIDWFSFIFAICLQLFLFSKSHYLNRKIINLSALIVYIGMIFFLLIIVSENSKYVSDTFKNMMLFEGIFVSNNLIPLVTVAGSIFAYFSIVIVNFGDFSRYVKNDRELKKGNLSIIANLIIFSFFALFIVIGVDIILNKKFGSMERLLTNPTDIIGKFDNIVLTISVLFFILFSSLSTNLIANYVPAQNSIINFLPNKLNLNISAIVIGLLGFIVGMFWLPILSQIGILSFIDTLSSFFGPIFGIIIIDYYIIKQQKLINKDIFSNSKEGAYYYKNGWNNKALFSLLIGFIFSASTIWNVNLNFLQSYAWIIGATISSLTYYLLRSK